MGDNAPDLTDSGYTMAYWDSEMTKGNVSYPYHPHPSGPGKEWHWERIDKDGQGPIYHTTSLLPYALPPNTTHSVDTGFAVFNGQMCGWDPATHPMKKNVSCRNTTHGDPNQWRCNCNEGPPMCTIDNGNYKQYDKDRRNETYGHVKGFIVFNKYGGIWLTHSNPGFPLNSTFWKHAAEIDPSSGGFEWVKTKYGQHFFCMSLPPESINTVAKLMAISYPHIQEYSVPESLQTQYADVSNLTTTFEQNKPTWKSGQECPWANGDNDIKKPSDLNNKSTPLSATMTFRTMGFKCSDYDRWEWCHYNANETQAGCFWDNSTGTCVAKHDGTTYNTETLPITITAFAKNWKWGQDMWGDLVAPALQSSMLVETWCHYNSNNSKRGCPKGWGNEPDKCCLPSKCDGEYTVQQVMSLNWMGRYENHTVLSNYTHAKWGISKPGRDGRYEDNGDWICWGDINRQITQRGRGGGAACMHGGPSGLWRRMTGWAPCQNKYVACPTDEPPVGPRCG